MGWVSITEQIDWSTPQGRLVGQMIGGFAEFFSGQLGTHVKKGIAERAGQGRHLGGLPFGYESCWAEVKGKKEQRCDPEHPGGVHVHITEGPIVAELFRRYAAGTATLATLAAWLNDQGFRTRNMHKSPNAQGNLVGGPRLFTTASVRTILHNPFYTGQIRHGDRLLPGAHGPLVSEAVFQAVQSSMKRNSGRIMTLQAHPEREYLLKGLARCAWCRLPMWSQTYDNGNRYYREHRASRGLMACPAGGGSLPCHVADEQVGKLMEALVLPQAWMDRVLARIQLEDEVKRIATERARAEEKLRRLGRTYRDGLCSDPTTSGSADSWRIVWRGWSCPRSTPPGRLAVCWRTCPVPVGAEHLCSWWRRGRLHLAHEHRAGVFSQRLRLVFSGHSHAAKGTEFPKDVV